MSEQLPYLVLSGWHQHATGQLWWQRQSGTAATAIV